MMIESAYEIEKYHQKMKCGSRQHHRLLAIVNVRNGKRSCHKLKHGLTFKLNFDFRIDVQCSMFGVDHC